MTLQFTIIPITDDSGELSLEEFEELIKKHLLEEKAGKI